MPALGLGLNPGFLRSCCSQKPAVLLGLGLCKGRERQSSSLSLEEDEGQMEGEMEQGKRQLEVTFDKGLE